MNQREDLNSSGSVIQKPPGGEKMKWMNNSGILAVTVVALMLALSFNPVVLAQELPGKVPTLLPGIGLLKGRMEGVFAAIMWPIVCVPMGAIMCAGLLATMCGIPGGLLGALIGLVAGGLFSVCSVATIGAVFFGLCGAVFSCPLVAPLSVVNTVIATILAFVTAGLSGFVTAGLPAAATVIFEFFNVAAPTFITKIIAFLVGIAAVAGVPLWVLVGVVVGAVLGAVVWIVLELIAFTLPSIISVVALLFGCVFGGVAGGGIGLLAALLTTFLGAAAIGIVGAMAGGSVGLIPGALIGPCIGIILGLGSIFLGPMSPVIRMFVPAPAGFLAGALGLFPAGIGGLIGSVAGTVVPTIGLGDIVPTIDFPLSLPSAPETPQITPPPMPKVNGEG